MQNLPILLPTPRNIQLSEGVCTLSKENNIILLNLDYAQAGLFSAARLRDALKAFTKTEMQINASHLSDTKNVAATLRVAEHFPIKRQGYHLKVTPQGIEIEAVDEAGLFYGCCTLIQLTQYYSPAFNPLSEMPRGNLPCMEISDAPDFPNRGVLLDISRDKVPTMNTLLDLVDLLASWKINQLQLYTEHTFAYLQHPEVWAEASPFTGEEIMRLDAYCRERFIELVPNQNSFGHMERWLKIPRYTPLAETQQGFEFPWGPSETPYFSLCPLDPGSLILLQSLYDELLPHFSSRQFNVGCDETFDLGQGRSKTECARLGTGRVYLDFLLIIYKEVKTRGFQMQFWGDIIMAHPELVPELPEDSIALEWGYEADHPFDEHGAKFAQAGLSFYVCPGTSAWNSIAGRTENCLANLANAAQNGIRHGADGYLVTDWGDNGHWQALPISYLGFAAGAAYSWCFQSNRELDIQAVLNHYAFWDLSQTMGKLAYTLGNIYRLVGVETPNESELFYILQNSIDKWNKHLNPEKAILAFQHALNTIDQAGELLPQINLLREDNEILRREFDLTVALLKHACMRGLYGYGATKYSKSFLANDLDQIVDEYREIWLLRNRPGGLEDSLARFTETKTAYR